MADRQPVAWVTGAGGLLGHYVVAAASLHAPGWRIRGLTRTELDLTDPAGVDRLWRAIPPDLLIHCAAVSKAAQCEADPKRARAVNVVATRYLAQRAADIPFIFLSTDNVFDGRKGWYRETDPVSPLTMYGRTKVEAEETVLANPLHTVLRTSLNAGLSPTGDRSFLEETLTAWRQGTPLRLFTDELRCPIAAAVTARAIWDLVGKSAPGLYHVAGAERLSRWEIGQLLATLYPELNPQCTAGSLRDYSGPPRAPDLSLDCTKLEACLSFPLPGFRSWLGTRLLQGRERIWDPLA